MLLQEKVLTRNKLYFMITNDSEEKSNGYLFFRFTFLDQISSEIMSRRVTFYFHFDNHLFKIDLNLFSDSREAVTSLPGQWTCTQVCKIIANS